MTIEHIADHEEQGISRFVDQFKEKPRMDAWARSYLRRCQDLEDVLWDILVKRTVDGADSGQLDVLGSIVDQPRRGQSDEEYRRFIAARIRVNRSHGQPEDLIAVFQLLTSSARSFAYEEHYPATVVINDNEPADFPQVVLEMLNDAKSAGVALFALLSAYAEDTTLVARDVTVGEWPADEPDRGVIDVDDWGTDDFGVLKHVWTP